MSKILIIGGVAGGASCAARLRRIDADAEIVMIERGEYISYANCGLPYRIGNVIQSRDSLLLMTPEKMRDQFNVDVRVQNEAISIDRNKKTVTIRELTTDRTYSESYDYLVLATGSSPLRPGIPGIDSELIHTLWTVRDTDEIRGMIQEKGMQTAAVIGGGFIGLEMAENLHALGLEVSLVEAADQVMAPLDYEMALMLHEHIRQNEVALYTGEAVVSFTENKSSAGEASSVTIALKSGKQIQSDLVILSIGVRPNSMIAKDAGLALNQRGGVKVSSDLLTSDPYIYAVGDIIEVEDAVLHNRTMVPLAGPANKQGRITANNIARRLAATDPADDRENKEVYHGTQGTSVAKVFELTAASTGANEKKLKAEGLVRGADYETLIITQNSHAGYYPGAVPITLKLIFSLKENHLILGAQIVGMEGVDKRIDTIAVAQRLGGSVLSLKELELAYAPPYSSAKDPVNMAGFVAENIMQQVMQIAPYDVMDTNPDALLLDIREDAERLAFEIPGAVSIPLGELRKALSENDTKGVYKDVLSGLAKAKNARQPIVVFCAVGVRAYNGARILMQNGFEKVSVYPGGTRFLQATHPEFGDFGSGAEVEYSDSGEVSSPQNENAVPEQSISIDCSGLQCPGPLMKVFEVMKDLQSGQVIEVVANDPGFTRDISAWCKRTGNILLSNTKKGKEYRAVIKKGEVLSPDKKTDPVSSGTELSQNKTIIVFDGDMDKVLASFVIANGALAMGRKVTMFFTFWGLTALRKPEKQKVSKTMMEKMFGFMLPRGLKKLKLSKMNMGGFGTSMMKKIMKDKNIDSLEDMVVKAIDGGVKIVACSMSMDVMGIKPDELIDGVEIGGVGTYLGDAENANVNLFV